MSKNDPRCRILAAMVALAIVPLYVFVLFSHGLRAAEPADAADPPGPVAMEMQAVALELTCRDAAMEGEFHPIHAGCSMRPPGGASVGSRYEWILGPARPRGSERPANRPRANAAAQQAGALTVLATLKPEGDAILEVDTSAGRASIRLRDVDFDAHRGVTLRARSPLGEYYRRRSLQRPRATTIIRPPPAAATAASGWPSSPTSAAASRTWRPPPEAISARSFPRATATRSGW